MSWRLSAMGLFDVLLLLAVTSSVVCRPGSFDFREFLRRKGVVRDEFEKTILNTLIKDVAQNEGSVNDDTLVGGIEENDYPTINDDTLVGGIEENDYPTNGLDMDLDKFYCKSQAGTSPRHKRCTGQNGGCCETYSQCRVMEGDCDGNGDCVGSLVCGNDNCYDDDDCCYSPNWIPPNRKTVGVTDDVTCVLVNHRSCPGSNVKFHVPIFVTADNAVAYCKSQCLQLGSNVVVMAHQDGFYPTWCWCMSGQSEKKFHWRTDERACELKRNDPLLLENFQCKGAGTSGVSMSDCQAKAKTANKDITVAYSVAADGKCKIYTKCDELVRATGFKTYANFPIHAARGTGTFFSKGIIASRYKIREVTDLNGKSGMSHADRVKLRDDCVNICRKTLGCQFISIKLTLDMSYKSVANLPCYLFSELTLKDPDTWKVDKDDAFETYRVCPGPACYDPIHCCSPSKKCNVNEGMCKQNGDCDVGLICGSKTSCPDMDGRCCIEASDPAVLRMTQGSRLTRCTVAQPCKEGQGMCTSDDGCEGVGMRCGFLNCKYTPNEAENRCCYKLPKRSTCASLGTNLKKGSKNNQNSQKFKFPAKDCMCSNSNLCQHGEGGCTDDAHCAKYHRCTKSCPWNPFVKCCFRATGKESDPSKRIKKAPYIKVGDGSCRNNDGSHKLSPGGWPKKAGTVEKCQALCTKDAKCRVVEYNEKKDCYGFAFQGQSFKAVARKGTTCWEKLVYIKVGDGSCRNNDGSHKLSPGGWPKKAGTVEDCQALCAKEAKCGAAEYNEHKDCYGFAFQGQSFKAVARKGTTCWQKPGKEFKPVKIGTCRLCSCESWNPITSTYTNCHSVTHCTVGYCGQCESDGKTPMPGGSGSHAAECLKYKNKYQPRIVYTKVGEGMCRNNDGSHKVSPGGWPKKPGTVEECQDLCAKEAKCRAAEYNTISKDCYGFEFQSQSFKAVAKAATTCWKKADNTDLEVLEEAVLEGLDNDQVKEVKEEAIHGEHAAEAVQHWG